MGQRASRAVEAAVPGPGRDGAGDKATQRRDPRSPRARGIKATIPEPQTKPATAAARRHGRPPTRPTRRHKQRNTGTRLGKRANTAPSHPVDKRDSRRGTATRATKRPDRHAPP